MKEKVKIFEKMIGLVMDKVVREGNEIWFFAENGDTFRFYHRQSCCEEVFIDEIYGDLEDLVGVPLVVAEELDHEDNGPHIDEKYPESYTWTLYRFATEKGPVQVRWYGSSNGYYSEKVDFEYNGKYYPNWY